MDGKFYNQYVCILSDLGSTYIYVNPDMVGKCDLNKEVDEKYSLVKLDIGTKKRVHHWVRDSAFELNGMLTLMNLNVLPFGSYNILLGMEWLYLHMTKVDCYENPIECLDDSGEQRFL